MKKNSMLVDTETRHVTEVGANIFLDLGFEKEIAEQYFEQSLQQINEMQALKEQLMNELATWIKENNLKQDQAAKILRVTRPRVSDMVNLKLSKFTIDTLIEMLARIGKPIKFVIG